MNIAKLAVSRPVTVWMVVFTAIFLGFISLSRLSVDLLPEMNFPIAAVATTYEGAGPQEVESLVTRPIEEAMTALGDVTRVSSVSTRGQSLVIVEFDWGTDMNFATLDMRERVDQVKEFLPEGAGARGSSNLTRLPHPSFNWAWEAAVTSRSSSESPKTS